MHDIIGVIAPLYILMAVGYVAVRTGYVPAGGLQALGGFVLRLCLPALIISAILSTTGRTLNPTFILGYGAASLLTLLGGLVVLRLVLRETGGRAAIGALGMACSNSAFVGLPLAMALVGETGQLVFTWAIVVENVLIIPLATTLAALAGARGGGVLRSVAASAKSIVQNPILIALAAGLALRATGITLPSTVRDGMDLLSAAAPGIALVFVGGALANFPLRTLDATIVAIAAGKLLVHPALTLVALGMLAVDDLHLRLGVLFAAAPMLSVFPIFAQAHGLGPRGAAAFMLATVASFASLVAILLWLGL